MPAPSIGPEQRCPPSERLAAALAVVDDVASDPLRLEREGVTRDDVKRLADTGVLSAGVGDLWSPPEVREIQERLAAASGALWFVMAQHRSPALAAATTHNTELRERYADGLSSGAMLGAVSFAHLRRARPSVVAERVDDSWQLSGRLDWITSWGLADVLLLMAETHDGRVVQFLLPADERPGLRTTGELSLAAMQGTSTVGAVLDRAVVADAEVAAVLPKRDWSAADAARTANIPPPVIGISRAALDELLGEAEVREWPEAIELAHEWRGQLLEQRSRAYSLIDDAEPPEFLEERLHLRASLTKLMTQVTAMLVVVQAGRAILATSNAQRWAGEAMFALVQAQTPATRNALIAAYRGDATTRAAP